MLCFELICNLQMTTCIGFWAINYKATAIPLPPENFQCLEVKFSIYLNRRVLVMLCFELICNLQMTTCIGFWAINYKATAIPLPPPPPTPPPPPHTHTHTLPKQQTTSEHKKLGCAMLKSVFGLMLWTKGQIKWCGDTSAQSDQGLITKTRLFKFIENVTTKKTWKFSEKNSDIFHISAKNIDCGYSLEPPCRGGSNEYPQSMLLSRNKKKCIPL